MMKFRYGLIVLAGMTLAADWPQFLGPNRDGVSTETGLLDTWPREGPPVVWEKNAGEGFSSPVVVGERVILFHRLGDQEVIECLSANKGQTLWKHVYPTAYDDQYGKGNGPRSTPVVADDKVYTLGAEAILTCVTLEKGEKVWQRPLAKDYRLKDSFFGVGTSPIVEGNVLAINLGAEGAGIVAFDKNTGKEVWKATEHEASYASPVAANLSGKRRLVFFTREGLVGIDPANGTVAFSKPWRARLFTSVNAASPLVVDDHIFLTSSYNTGAILLKMTDDNLEEVWKGDEAISCHFNTPVYHDGFLYGIDGRQETGTEFRCVEWKTGKVRWGKETLHCASLLRVGDRLIALSEHGELALLKCNPDRYEELARATVLTRPCRAHLALANGRLYARDDKKLVCWKVVK